MPKYIITCPYCFESFNDEQVHFRSAKFNKKTDDAGIIPDDYESVEDFINIYNGNDKESILQKYRDWDFFTESKDEKYEEYWKKYGGTTEPSLSEKTTGIKDYYRKVIDPKDINHQRYLVKQSDDSFFIRENDMATRIRLTTGELCKDRVCPHCHNPLPPKYGMYEVKFISIIGITGAGKTVFLSQFLKKFSNEIYKIGMVAPAYTDAVKHFIQKNNIEKGKTLPQPTPVRSLQQPLIFEISENQDSPHKHIVLYDVAGELFDDQAGAIGDFAGFVQHSDGVIVLLDPSQFEGVANAKGLDRKNNPVTALESVYNVINRNNIPISVCISKSDFIYDVLGSNVENMIREDYAGVADTYYYGQYKSEFNATDFNPLERAISEFVLSNEPGLYNHLNRVYSDYAYFAITALGCDVVQTVENNQNISSPAARVSPKRILDPIFWLFHRFGFIGANETLFSPAIKRIYCPNPVCKSDRTRKLEQPHIEIKKEGLFKKIEYRYYHVCDGCGAYFNVAE